MELSKIKIWPGWTATRLIGEGSFGKVYEIVRNNFGIEEHSALKIITIPSSQAELQSLKNDGMDDAGATEYYRGLVDEFVQEIALMSKLKGNSNIVNYEDYAVIEHNVSIGWDILIRMELLNDLPSYIRNNSLSTNDVIKLGIDICNALEACQTQKIIHRDIKPDNIFISASGEYKLGDFGVARTIEKTVSGLSKKGTYTYMAPEVYKGENYGLTVDIYSLGIVMYKLLNFNREPFLPPHPQPIKYSDKNSALVKRMNGEIIPPPANANEKLTKIILKACEHKPENRYKSPVLFKKDLIAALKDAQSVNDAILQTDQVVSSKTNSNTSSKTVDQQNEKSDIKPENIEKTMPVAHLQNVENSAISTPAGQNVQHTNQPPKVYVFGGQSNNPAQPRPRDPQAIPNNQPQYRAPQVAPNNQPQYRAPQAPRYNQSQPRVPQMVPNGQQHNITNSNHSGKRIAGNILGWIGFGLWLIELIVLFPKTLLQTIGILVTQILFTAKKDSKAAAIIMMVSSILSFAVMNFIVSIMYLKICNNKKQ